MTILILILMTIHDSSTTLGRLPRGRLPRRVRGHRPRLAVPPVRGQEAEAEGADGGPAGPLPCGEGAHRPLQEPQGVHPLHPPDPQGRQEEAGKLGKIARDDPDCNMVQMLDSPLKCNIRFLQQTIRISQQLCPT